MDSLSRSLLLTPQVTQALLNKKGVEDTAVRNNEYYVQRLQKVMGA